MHSDSARYDEAIEVKPKGSRTAGTGAVVDPRSSKYPSTHEFASGENENASRVDAGRMSRRPSGSLRARRGLACTCGKHPCSCGTEKAHEALATQSEGRKSTVNMC
jgi:hypothetical protein